jgi:Ca-activated chloride channel family protein
VRDALSAADLGEKLDPKATDWAKLREELENLLKKQDNEQQQQDKPQDQQDKEQQQQDQQQNQDQKQNDQQQQNDPQKQNEKKKEDQQPQEQKQDPGEKAFGDMKQKNEPPPPPEHDDTQKVGGAEPREEPEPVDPSLALPLQKLDQLKNQDSPAQLFQLMDGEKKAPKKPAKDW